MKRLLGAVLCIFGSVLAVVNLALVPSVARFHQGEWVPVAFHVAVVVAGSALAYVAWRWLVRVPRSPT